MKKIIDGKLYNTRTAEQLHYWGNGHMPRDFHHCVEVLYRTKKGAFFLYGMGGALSKYSTHCGTTRGPGEDIIPLTSEEALRWLEVHDGAETILEHFGGDIEEA